MGPYQYVLLMVMATTCLARMGETDSHGWQEATATFYGDMSGAETMQGACGYGDLFKQGYGLQTTALSTALFNDGLSCGACFQLVCHNSRWCVQGAGSITVTATNFCPPNYTKADDHWCNPPRQHFDLSQPMFRKIAIYEGGIVPVFYRRVSCVKAGGIKFEIVDGNPWWTLILVYNVAGAGEVVDVKIKGSKTGWLQMTRSWGQRWQTFKHLQGQSLSFQVTTSNRRMVDSDNVAPANWRIGQTFEGKQF